MTRIIIILAAVLAIGAGGYLAAKRLYDAGREAERAETLKRAMELVIERDKIDADLKTASPADICHRLGGRWLPDENECG